MGLKYDFYVSLILLLSVYYYLRLFKILGISSK